MPPPVPVPPIDAQESDWNYSGGQAVRSTFAPMMPSSTPVEVRHSIASHSNATVEETQIVPVVAERDALRAKNHELQQDLKKATEDKNAAVLAGLNSEIERIKMDSEEKIKIAGEREGLQYALKRAEEKSADDGEERLKATLEREALKREAEASRREAETSKREAETSKREAEAWKTEMDASKREVEVLKNPMADEKLQAGEKAAADREIMLKSEFEREASNRSLTPCRSLQRKSRDALPIWREPAFLAQFHALVGRDTRCEEVLEQFWDARRHVKEKGQNERNELRTEQKLPRAFADLFRQSLKRLHASPVSSISNSPRSKSSQAVFAKVLVALEQADKTDRLIRELFAENAAGSRVITLIDYLGGEAGILTALKPGEFTVLLAPWKEAVFIIGCDSNKEGSSSTYSFSVCNTGASAECTVW
jgi:hypothetical protein